LAKCKTPRSRGVEQEFLSTEAFVALNINYVLEPFPLPSSLVDFSFTLKKKKIEAILL
jgi:hypothetical protein